MMSNMQQMMAVIGTKFGEVQADQLDLRTTVLDQADANERRFLEAQAAKADSDRQLEELC